MVYLTDWLNWQRQQNTHNLWRYLKNNSEYKDFINIWLDLFLGAALDQIQSCPKCKIGIYKEILKWQWFFW